MFSALRASALQDFNIPLFLLVLLLGLVPAMTNIVSEATQVQPRTQWSLEKYGLSTEIYLVFSATDPASAECVYSSKLTEEVNIA